MKLGLKLGLDTNKLSNSLGTLIYESDFSVNTDGFVVIQTTISGNIDGISGVNDTLRATINSATNIHRFQKNSAWNVGDSVTILFDYYIPSSNSLVDNIGLITGVGADGRKTFSVLDSWTSDQAVFELTAGNTLVFEMRDGTSISFTGNSSDVVYIKNIKVYKT